LKHRAFVEVIRKIISKEFAISTCIALRWALQPAVWSTTSALVVRHGAKRSAVSGDATPAGAFVAYYKPVLLRRSAKPWLTRSPSCFPD